jgi:hypothetical protein
MFNQWQLPGVSETPSRGSPITDGEKLDFIFKQLKKWKWSLGFFLSMVFEQEMASSCEPEHPNDPKWCMNRERCEQVHRAYVTQFLAGNSNITALNIVKLMYHHPYARPSSAHYNAQQYFSTSTPASQILYAKPALSTWALEIVAKTVWHKSNFVVSKDAGMWVCASRKGMGASEVIADSVTRSAETRCEGLTALHVCTDSMTHEEALNERDGSYWVDVHTTLF